MALAKCRECGKEISTEAKVCPNCGKTNPTSARVMSTAGALGCFGLIVVMALIGSLSSSGSSGYAAGKPSAADVAPTTAEHVPSPAERQASILAVGIPTCKLSSKRTKLLLKRYPEWADHAILLVGCRQIQVGMTQEQLLASWGNPERVNSTTTPAGRDDQLVYGDNYVYLSDGVVTSYQTSH